MFKLHRLELSGFKSFVDPSALEFAGGITGIVGPNGCGKSNLSDAITWVLGEQSAKSLRGDTMEDVIFAGSDARRPLGMAEATVTFLTDPAFPHAEEGRIAISRRVFRSGESQYRLNGKVVRLKEIKDLLMDTGLGVRAYSVIEQGKIGLILSSRPQERRKLIEEAAGVTRYKARKRIAEVKLEEASANLLRLDDIVAEVERNLRSLKRQAGAARRWQQKDEEHRSLQRQTLLGRWWELHRGLAELTSRLATAQAAEAELAASIHRHEAALAARREEVALLSERLASRHQRQAELAATIEGRQEFLRGGGRTLEEIAARVAAGAALAERRATDLAGHRAATATLEQRRDELISEHGLAAAEVAEDLTRLAAAEESLRGAEIRLESLRAELLAAIGEVTSGHNRLHREQIESEKGSMRLLHLDQELTARTRELKEAESALTEARTRAATLVTLTAEREVDLQRAQSELQLALDHEAEVSQRLRGLETRLTAARERRRYLAQLAEAQEEQRAGLERRLAEAGVAVYDLLGERLRARPGWEQALDEFLGELTEAVILPEGDQARALAESLAAGEGAGATLLTPMQPAGAPGAFGAWPQIEDPAILGALDEALDLPAELARALPPAFLVATPSDAQRLARQNPGVAFLARPRLWARGGLLHVSGEASQPGVLVRRRELAELADSLPRMEGELEETSTQLATLIEERASAAESLRQRQGELAGAQQEAAVAAARLEEAGARHHRVALTVETLSTEHAELERELGRVSERQERLATEVAAAEQRHSEHQQALDATQWQVEQKRTEREALRTGGAGRRGRLDLLVERLSSLEQEIARERRAVAEEESHLAAWKDEADSLATRRQELEAAITRARDELQEALERRAAAEGELRSEQEELEEGRRQLKGLDEELQAERLRQEEARSAVEDLRVASVGAEHDARHLADTFRSEFQQELPESPEPPRQELPVLEEALARCKAALDALGPVNVLAAQEFTEQEERHAFLTTQRADVARSVESLRNTIREINQTSSERFRTAFTAVNEQFSRTFSELFRGGEAEMRLLDEEDLLDSGIEIVARPPGKKLQNLMLLSGGEKALTAIALLFALFRTKPSPFCILDEVDAPLDDVNTLRFVGMLQELANETQCIMITHNKLTMEVASTLYGVTMEEKGVSKLVAVTLEEVQPAESAASA